MVTQIQSRADSEPRQLWSGSLCRLTAVFAETAPWLSRLWIWVTAVVSGIDTVCQPGL